MKASYRKKPVITEAWQVTAEDVAAIADWVSDNGQRCDQWLDHLDIVTLEGTMRADLGDFVLRGVHGEFYPCKPDIFNATYEALAP